ncbi:hypothetical protein DL96DRAFT_1620798 [Flagelloscypha sp. PMI_526]|nr:hypothetical protein DL96DRAFT_1620798 [Flagelloscypha sp. PMI_526]
MMTTARTNSASLDVISDSIMDTLSHPSTSSFTSTSLLYVVTPLRKMSSTLNATYSLASGQAIYKVETPREWLAPKATVIQRVKAGSGPVDEFETIATIHHNTLGPSIFEFGNGNGGDRIQSTVLMTKPPAFAKGSWSAFGRDRILKLPDGREARWSLGSRVCSLALNDGRKTPLALFHQPTKRPGSLEIFAEVFNAGSSTDYQQGILTESQRRIVDFILVTFLYVERIRMAREEAAESG